MIISVFNHFEFSIAAYRFVKFEALFNKSDAVDSLLLLLNKYSSSNCFFLSSLVEV